METLYNMNELKRYNIINLTLSSNLTILDAAKRLGLSTRQIKRIRKKVIELGPEGIKHGNCNKPSPRKIPDTTIKQIIYLKKTDNYSNTNFSHFRDLLEEREGMNYSYATIYRILHNAGFVSKRKYTVKKIHRLRKRRKCFGELVQADGTPYDWFGTGKMVTLHGFIDDATGIPLGLYFCENECLFGYLEVTRQMLMQYGIPEELYPDKHSIFFPSLKQKASFTIKDELSGATEHLTQYGSIMKELGVYMHPAPTAEAKGRIERLWNTLQDRLTEEMRIDGINNIDDANRYLKSFIKRYSKRFAIKPVSDKSKFIPLPDYIDLNLLLSIKFTRKIDRGGTFSIHNRRFQILNNDILPNAIVNVYLSHKVGIVATHKGRIYQAVCIEELPSHYQNLTFDKFCREHFIKGQEFAMLLMSYNAKNKDPILAEFKPPRSRLKVT